MRLNRQAFLDPAFKHQLANFLSHMNHDLLDKAAAHTRKADYHTVERRGVTHPMFISAAFGNPLCPRRRDEHHQASIPLCHKAHSR